MHNLAPSSSGLKYACLGFDADENDLQAAVDGLRALKVRGWNVTMPNKTDVIQYLDNTDRTVYLIGACSTVVNDDGVLSGYNTDGGGWVAGLKDNGFDIKDTTFTEIGAGGASTAMLVQAALDDVSKILCSTERTGSTSRGNHGSQDQRIYRYRRVDERFGGLGRLQSRGGGVVATGECHRCRNEPPKRESHSCPTPRRCATIFPSPTRFTSPGSRSSSSRPRRRGAGS